MKPGDLITGIDRSYPRSIYQVVGVSGDTLLANWVALSGVTYSADWGVEQIPYSFPMGEFRLATNSEIAEAKGIFCECGAESLGHPGHSDWCKLFKN
jgi:hypothetical protein